VVVCGALGAVVANRVPQRSVFLAVAQLVPAGATVSPSDLETVSINPAAGLDAIPLRDAGEVIGRRATETLEPGSLLVPGELASGQGLPAGRALVGTSLAVNQMPAELAAGDRVLVVLSGTGGSPTSSSATSGTPAGPDGSPTGALAPSPAGPAGSVLTQATVISISAPGGTLATVGAASAAFVVTLDVPEAAAPAVTAASAAGNVSLAVLGGSDAAGAVR